LKRTLPARRTHSRLVNQPFLPSPWAVFIEMINQFRKGFLGPHIAVSLFRVITALIAAFIPALILGVSAGMHKKIDNIISLVVYILFPIPKVALLPIILLFLGLGNGSKIFLVALIVFFQFYLNIRDETNGLNRK